MNRAEKGLQKNLEGKAAKKVQLIQPVQETALSPKSQQTMTIDQAIDLGVLHHNAGDLPKAKTIYQQILQAEPNQPAALHLLGVIAHQAGENDIAVELIGKALAIIPDYADAPPLPAIPFKHGITLKNLAFKYTEDTPWVLQSGLNLSIPKGSRIGFIGATGSGKSTLLDIIMGLLQPTKGSLAIDDVNITEHNYRGWQAHIAHVPQAIFLSDASIAENIAFGEPAEQIDYARVRQAAQKAQISETIESWTNQYNTEVGERGVRLSGGQRQRIGIARALYKKADVIVLDEATSALDDRTELAVMKAIENLGDDLTVIIVAHRLTTLKNCTQIVELEDGRIKRTGSYQNVIGD